MSISAAALGAVGGLMNICLFTAEEIGKPLSARDERGEHIIKVLRLLAGDTFTAGIIGAASGEAQITKIEDGLIHYTFTPTGDGKPLMPLVLIVGFPRPIQLRRLLRDAASLGAGEVHLTGTEMGDKSYMKSTLLERGAARRALLEGAAQAGSTHASALFMHQTLKECLDAAGEAQGALRIALDNARPAMPLIDFLHSAAARDANGAVKCIAAIGAERGWTDGERQMFIDGGYTLCSMGSRILRTETAVTAASSIIFAELWQGVQGV